MEFVFPVGSESIEIGNEVTRKNSYSTIEINKIFSFDLSIRIIYKVSRHII